MGDVRWWNGLKECSSKGFTLVSVGISLDRFLATLSSVNASCLPPSDTRTIRNRTQPRPVLWCSSARVSLYAFEPPHGQRARRWHSESRVALTGTERWPILFMKATFALGLRLCFHYYFNLILMFCVLTQGCSDTSHKFRDRTCRSTACLRLAFVRAQSTAQSPEKPWLRVHAPRAAALAPTLLLHLRGLLARLQLRLHFLGGLAVNSAWMGRRGGFCGFGGGSLEQLRPWPALPSGWDSTLGAPSCKEPTGAPRGAAGAELWR